MDGGEREAKREGGSWEERGDRKGRKRAGSEGTGSVQIVGVLYSG